MTTTDLPSASSPSGVQLNRDAAAPVYAPRRGEHRVGTVEGAGGELLANYVLFEEAIQKAAVPYRDYSTLTSEERNVYMAHLQSIEERKLRYKDPATGYVVMNTSQLILQGKCCGNGCRHCPYEHENAPPEVKRSKKWNGAYYV